MEFGFQIIRRLLRSWNSIMVCTTWCTPHLMCGWICCVERKPFSIGPWTIQGVVHTTLYRVDDVWSCVIACDPHWKIFIPQHSLCVGALKLDVTKIELMNNGFRFYFEKMDKQQRYVDYQWVVGGWSVHILCPATNIGPRNKCTPPPIQGFGYVNVLVSMVWVCEYWVCIGGWFGLVYKGFGYLWVLVSTNTWYWIWTNTLRIWIPQLSLFES